jgi:formate dehydrogenase iron-sulfur subunit
MIANKSMLIDVSKCMACRACQVACKQWNQLPAEKTHFTGSYQNPPNLSGKTWTLISFTEPEEGETRWLFRKLQCLHCTQASCVLVCPTGAAIRRDDGVVVIDQAACTGCKACVESCPFNTPKYDPETGTARKCTFCLDRVENGLEPACAKVCPTGAITYGEREEMLQLAKKRQSVLAAENPAAGAPRIYGEKELGGLGVIYLLPEEASIYELPDRPQVPTARVIFKWLMGIIPGAIVLYGLWRHFGKNKVVEDVKSESGGE